MKRRSDRTRQGKHLRTGTIAVVLTATLVLVGAAAAANAAAGIAARWPVHRPGHQLIWGALPGPSQANLVRAWSASDPPWPSGRPPGWAPTVGVGPNPVGDLVDPATHTLYVANGNDDTVSVISTLTCNATNTSGCYQTPETVQAGPGPLSLALDDATHTLYATDLNGGTGDTVAMINAATCNASEHSGCGQTPRTVVVGSAPALLAIDPATDTVYVPNSNQDTVSVINGATCNATDITGCANTMTVTAGSGANAIDIDPRTHTAYVANYNAGTVSLIDTATCNATVSAGCRQTPPTVSVGPQPAALVVDQASDTVYAEVGPTGDGSLGSAAMINGATCNATVTSGCGQTPRTTPVGSGPIWMAENPNTRTVYAVNEEDDDVSMINAITCNAIDDAGCRQAPPALAIGGKTSAIVTPATEDGAGAVAVDPSTNTLYATSQDENNVSVLNGATCDAGNTSGCTRFAATTTVGSGPQGVAANPATNTIYAANRDDNTVSVIDAKACNATERAGCGRVWPTFKVGNYAQDLRVDAATDTIYVVNANDNTVSVINGAICNAHDSSGCDQTPATINVGAGPFALGIDTSTDTIYVANNGDNTVSVIDGATCNGTHTNGCRRTPPTIAVGNGPDGIAVDQTTNTIYVANGGDNTVSMIDGVTCNATNMNGCGQTPPTVSVGNGPYPIDVDQRTDTVYVGNIGDSTLSLINGASCNATTGGCSRAPTTVPVEQLPFGIAIDQRRDTVYVTSIVDGDVATIDGRSCTATTHDCRPSPVPVRMGGWGGAIALDPTAGTAYVPDNVDGSVSLFGLTPP